MERTPLLLLRRMKSSPPFCEDCIVFGPEIAMVRGPICLPGQRNGVERNGEGLVPFGHLEVVSVLRVPYAKIFLLKHFIDFSMRI